MPYGLKQAMLAQRADHQLPPAEHTQDAASPPVAAVAASPSVSRPDPPRPAPPRRPFLGQSSSPGAPPDPSPKSTIIGSPHPGKATCQIHRAGTAFQWHMDFAGANILCGMEFESRPAANFSLSASFLDKLGRSIENPATPSAQIQPSQIQPSQIQPAKAHLQPPIVDADTISLTLPRTASFGR